MSESSLSLIMLTKALHREKKKKWKCKLSFLSRGWCVHSPNQLSTMKLVVGAVTEYFRVEQSLYRTL